jgi:uncharacterized lipoprotein YmbA
VALASATLVLCGCGTFPLHRVYVLGDPNPSTPGVTDEAGRPHIELKTVTVPDYIDTTDITRRTASNEVTTSTTGRWGERVSIGVTRVLAIDLARRLPEVVIESRGAFEPSRRLFVDVERFEISEDGRCTLSARWRLASSDGKISSSSEQATFVESATSKTDAAAALAMTSAIDELSSEIAASVNGTMALR